MQAKQACMYVYRLKSQNYPAQAYTGITTNPKQRLIDHNSGKSTHTNKYKPWQMEICIWFANERKARAFEQYLKSGSGRAFSAKHFKLGFRKLMRDLESNFNRWRSIDESQLASTIFGSDSP